MESKMDISCKDCKNFNMEDNPYCTENASEGYCLLNGRCVNSDGCCSDARQGQCGQRNEDAMTKEEIDAKSKEEALKPQRYYFNKYLFKCRRCSKVLDIIEHNYCPQCGQKIDWSEYPTDKKE